MFLVVARCGEWWPSNGTKTARFDAPFERFKQLDLAVPVDAIDGARRRVPPSTAVCELMNALVGQPKQSRGISGAHLQMARPENSNGLACGRSRAFVLSIRLLAQRGVRPNRLCGRGRQLDVVDEIGFIGMVDEESERLPDSASRLIHGPALRVASANLPNRRDPPPGSVPLVRYVIRVHFSQPFPRLGSRSRSILRRSPTPMSSPA